MHTTPDVACFHLPTEATTIAFTTRQTSENWLKNQTVSFMRWDFLIIIWGRKTEERYGWSLLSELEKRPGPRLSVFRRLTDLPILRSKIGWSCATNMSRI